MSVSPPAVEPREGRVAAWLRERRLKIALLVGAAETIAIVVTEARWWWAVLLAAAFSAVYFAVGRQARSASLRQLSWTAAASQAVPVVVPLIIFAVGTLLVIAVVVLAVVLLVMLFLDRK